MIVTEQKPLKEILGILKDYKKIFLIGCGECATDCKTGGKDELAVMQKELEKKGKIILGSCIPDAPCVAAQIKTGLAKHKDALGQTDALLVLACGLGAQSVKDNLRQDAVVLPACDTLFGASMDARGNFSEKCSLCGECVLDLTLGFCPVTLCPKGLLNGPCSGVDKGKCEIDKNMDCVWILIFQESARRGKLKALTVLQPPRDFQKTTKPRRLILK